MKRLIAMTTVGAVVAFGGAGVASADDLRQSCRISAFRLTHPDVCAPYYGRIVPPTPVPGSEPTPGQPGGILGRIIRGLTGGLL